MRRDQSQLRIAEDSSGFQSRRSQATPQMSRSYATPLGLAITFDVVGDDGAQVGKEQGAPSRPTPEVVRATGTEVHGNWQLVEGPVLAGLAGGGCIRPDVGSVGGDQRLTQRSPDIGDEGRKPVGGASTQSCSRGHARQSIGTPRIATLDLQAQSLEERTGTLRFEQASRTIAPRLGACVVTDAPGDPNLV